MIIPAAMDIYSAQDALKKRPQQVAIDELKELCDSGAANSAPDQSFESGYLLGLEVARIILRGEPAIYQAGLKPENLL